MFTRHMCVYICQRWKKEKKKKQSCNAKCHCHQRCRHRMAIVWVCFVFFLPRRELSNINTCSIRNQLMPDDAQPHLLCCRSISYSWNSYGYCLFSRSLSIFDKVHCEQWITSKWLIRNKKFFSFSLSLFFYVWVHVCIQHQHQVGSEVIVHLRSISI